MAMHSGHTASLRGMGDLTAAAVLFRSLGDPTRLAIVRRLAASEARVVDLTTELGLPQSTVSSHLACLRECGLIDYRPQGRSSIYRVIHPELIAMLSEAETLLQVTGETVTLCPRYGVAPAGTVAAGSTR